MFIILQFNNLDLTLTKSMKRIYFVETVDLLFLYVDFHWVCISYVNTNINEQ